MKRVTIILMLVVAMGVLIGVFFWGRASVHVPAPGTITRDTVWLWRPAVHDTVYLPPPAAVTPAPDTVYRPSVVDTAALFAVWCDYYATRDYKLDFSNDTLGVFRVDATVTENKITRAVSTVQPRAQVITTTEVVEKTRFLRPWAMVSTSTDFNFQALQLGVDLNDKWMIGVGGIRHGADAGVVISGGVKF